MSHLQLREAAEAIAAQALSLGAEEVTVRVGEGSYSQIERRDGKVEKAQESRSRSAGLSLMVEGRYSSHSSNDLRPDAMRAFLERAIAATRFMEPDPDRRLPDRDLMGDADVDLDPFDPAFESWQAADRGAAAERLEQLCQAQARSVPTRSISAYAWDGRSDSALVASNGFASSWSGTSCGHGASISLEDSDGRLPEAWSSYQTRHRADLPSAERVAEELVERGRKRLGSKAAPSGRYRCCWIGRWWAACSRC